MLAKKLETSIQSAWMPDGLLREYSICTRCVMDTTDPWISFDVKGECNHCQYFDRYCAPAWRPGEEGQALLESLIQEIKSYGEGRDYDCIIGLSGGVDSSYITVKAVEWGLRPLIVHVDAGWNSELAVQNIEQLVNRLGLDLITHVVDWEEMKDLQLAFLRSNLANQDVPQDHAFFAALYNYARRTKIKYVINGSNYATESILPQSWGYNAMDVTHLHSVHRKFGKRKLKTFPLISFFQFYIYYPRIWKMRVLTPLNYLPYSKSHAIRFLEENYGWRYYGGKHFESRWTRFFQSYYLPVKFGYDKRKAHFSSLVVAGEMSREEALRELAKPPYDEASIREDKIYVAKKLGISVDELESLIVQPPSHYTHFPNNEKLLQWSIKNMRRLSMPVRLLKAVYNKYLKPA